LMNCAARGFPPIKFAKPLLRMCRRKERLDF
jgi:hypothetical protein